MNPPTQTNRLPANVRLLNKDYCSDDVLSAKGKRVMYRRIAGFMLSRFSYVRNLPYMAGNGFRIGEARPCIEIVSQIRNATPVGLVGDYHPLAKLPLSHHPFGWDDRR